jgi:hypothetical protein
VPSACVNDCGLTVVDGALEVDWMVVGVARGVAQSASFTVPVTAANSDYVGPYGTQRLSYTNNTCQPMLVEYEAYIPFVSTEMVDGNWWTTALFWTHRIGSAPPANSFDIATVALIRSAYITGQPGSNPVSAVIPGRHTMVVVQPGETLHMMASVWVRITNYAPAGGNRLYVERIALQYRRWPLAA